MVDWFLKLLVGEYLMMESSKNMEREAFQEINIIHI